MTHDSGKGNNKLIMGDNLSVMKTLLNDGVKVDLVYIDPPFATGRNFRYNKEKSNSVSICKDDVVAYNDNITGSKFIEFIRERLIFIRELMSDHASIYVHIDYKIGHYVKVIMDEIFGISNYRNGISRIKCVPKNFARRGYGNIKDMVLFYTKTNDFVWNDIFLPIRDYDVKKYFPKVDVFGRRYNVVNLFAPGEVLDGETCKEWRGIKPSKGRHWAYKHDTLDKLDFMGRIYWSSGGRPGKIIYANESKGQKMQDVWDFKDSLQSCYPTEKNLKMIETIIKTSSIEGDLVFDCFLGSGTTAVVSQKLNRRWIGIDNSPIAIKTAMERLNVFSYYK